MGPTERLFKTSYAPELLRLGENDLVAARVLAGGKGVRPETTLLMVQQAVEKCLKAVLVARGRPLPLTHDLSAVVALLDAADKPPHAADIEELTPFATVRRYEEGRFDISVEEVEAALKLAQDVVDWCAARVPGGSGGA